MCMNCGCGEPEERHGNDANITLTDLRRAGEANGQDLDTTMGNLERAWHESPEAAGLSGGHGHEYGGARGA
jgi:hypothetical protein